MAAESIVMVPHKVQSIFLRVNLFKACLFEHGSSMGKRVRPPYIKRPSVLYSLIGDIPIDGHSMEAMEWNW